MKKYILLISLCFSSVLFAQEKLIFGFDLGSNFTSVHNTYVPPNTSFSYTPSFLWGIQAGYGFNDAFTIRLQFFYDQRIIQSKQKFNYIDSAGTAYGQGVETDENSTSYFEIPVTLKYSFSSERSQWYIFGGPLFAIESESWGEKFRDVALTAGVGFSRGLTHIVTLFAESGYTFGLSNLSSDYSYKSFSRNFRINTGLLFNIALPIEY